MPDVNEGKVQDDISDFKRVRYLDPSFKYMEEDFRVDQEYHIRMRYRHNKLLYNPGVLDGLEVIKDGDLGIKVRPGVAIDGEGRELVLVQEDSKPAPVGVNSLSDENKVFSIVLAYKVEKSKADSHPTAGDRQIRWLEKPEITFVPCIDNTPCDQLPDGTKGVVLCKVKVKRVTGSEGEKNILEEPDFSVRKYLNLRSFTVLGGMGVMQEYPSASTPSEANPNRKHALISRYADVDEPFTIGVGILGESKTGDGVEGVAHVPKRAGIAGYNDAPAVTDADGKPDPVKNGIGVWGGSPNGVGVYGSSVKGIGVYGESSEYSGVKGVAHGDIQHGVVGIHHTNTPWNHQAQTGVRGLGVYGESNSHDGVAGVSTSPVHAGVSGRNDSSGLGMWAYSDKGTSLRVETGPHTQLAAYFNGNVTINGTLNGHQADCAEDFDICESVEADPGSVMVVGKDGILHPCQQAYDKRVAGVISGAGCYKPAIVLDSHEHSKRLRKPIALLGKVYCKADAQYGAIEVGDLLTTSPTCGHAMKACDPHQAFGTVIGKALAPLAEGQGLIPILIALQ